MSYLNSRPTPAFSSKPAKIGTTARPIIAAGQIHADHLAQPVGLAVEREVVALDLLVVLELGLEELRHLHGRARRAGDAHAGEVVGLEDLLDATARDLIAGGRLAIAGHDHAVAEGRTERTVVPCGLRDGGGRRSLVAGHQVRRLAAEQLEKAGVE